MTLIGVKSKYGSCNGNCTGFFNHLTLIGNKLITLFFTGILLFLAYLVQF